MRTTMTELKRTPMTMFEIP